MLVSIITVCYNSEKTVAKAIESVLNQTYPEIEYIVVDGASRDNTVAIAESYAEQFRAKGYDYKVISEKDNGIYDAMNKGITMAKGELIGMINSDDWYEPIAVETAAKTYLETGYDLFYADLNLIRDDGSIIVKAVNAGDEAVAADIAFPGGDAQVEITVLTGELEDVNTLDNPDCVKPVQETTCACGGKLAWTLAPRSVTMMKIKA